MDALRNALYTVLRKSRSRVQSGSFYPAQALLDVLSRDLVYEAISTSPRVGIHERGLIVSLVLERIPKIFSILLVDHNESYFLDFLHRQEYDRRLPFLSKQDLSFLNGSVAGKLLDRQWEFVPPLLVKNELHRELKDDDILPFLSDEYVNRGAFGDVYKVALCPGHQALIDGDNVS
jgi:hypothetical protein